MIYKLNNGGVVKLQNAWTTMPSVEDAILKAWANQSAKEKAEKQVASEKPKYTYVNPYDYLHGWREATEDAAKQDKYTVENLGGSKEEAEAAYNATKENAAKQLAGTTATGLGTVALLGLSGGAAGPVAADIVNTGFGAHGLYNALSGNGIQKTVRLANQGDTWGTVKSGAGDLLDLSMGLHAAKLWGNLGKSMLAGQSLGNAYRGNVVGREMSNLARKATTYSTPVELNNTISFTPRLRFTNTVHFDPRVKPLSKPISEFEKNGRYTLDELHQMGFKLPRKHLQGDDAVKMFKEYGTIEIPENSQIIEQLRKYVPEARERYGLIGNTNITDDEIAGSLYKKVLELGGDTAAVNDIGEPLALFRGDTKRYLALKPRTSPEKLVNGSGTMDNSLGTLFLDDFGKPVLTHGGGPERYLAGWDYVTDSWNYRGGGAGEPYNHLLPEIDRNTPSGILWGLKPAINSKYGHLVGFIKAPSKSTVSGANDLNAFVVRTPKVRNSTNEIAVLNENEDALLRGYWGSTPHHSGKLYTNVNGQERWRIGEESFGASKAPRKLLAEHFTNILNDAKSKGEGLIMSEPGAILRDEHKAYGYYALPNFNILGAKHILPFDLRMPTQWGSRIIYRKQGGILKAQNGTFEDFWNTLPQNQQDSTDFNVRRYWELNGKPSNFKEAVKRGMYKKEKDGYHANSIAFNEETGEYEFMKSPNHPTIKYELDWFNSDKAKKFRNKYQLDSTSIPWKYIPKKQQGGFVNPFTNQLAKFIVDSIPENPNPVKVIKRNQPVKVIKENQPVKVISTGNPVKVIKVNQPVTLIKETHRRDNRPKRLDDVSYKNHAKFVEHGGKTT